jgi:hypothetical protein
LGRSGAPKYEQTDATFAVSLIGIKEVLKPLKRGGQGSIRTRRGGNSTESMWALSAALDHGAGCQAGKCEDCTADRGEHNAEGWPEWSSQRCVTRNEVNTALPLWLNGRALSWAGRAGRRRIDQAANGSTAHDLRQNSG